MKKTTTTRIGILGGGQLAQMLAQAAWPLGLHVSVLVKRRSDALPGLDGVAVEGDPNDPATAAAFARTVDVVTLESEFIDPAALAAIEQTGTPLRPHLASVQLIQDKWLQKQTLIQQDLPVVPCRTVDSPADVVTFGAKHGWPVVLKRRHLGYDGKGNATVSSADEVNAAWASLHNQQGLYVEAFCPFERELAVMVCRALNGQTAVYPVVDTVQKDHICHLVRAPASVPPDRAEAARTLAVSAITAIGGIGAMGVELFLARDGQLLINELAPRVHNSGHYTIEGCVCSQFENHIRAITGLPLGSTALVRPAAVMINILGPFAPPSDALAIPGVHLHIYGKSDAKPGRKMGHITALGDTLQQAEATATRAATVLAPQKIAQTK